MRPGGGLIPTVGIGMPVLNGACTIERALRSLLAQTYRDFEVVVCDNASDDETRVIVSKVAKTDPRVRLVAFETRVDILGSYRRAFESCQSPFFAFAPADDFWAQTFLEDTLGLLQSRPELSCCCALIAMESDGRFSHYSPGTRPLLGDVGENIASFLRCPDDGGRAYGLFRREALAGAFPDTWHFGWDYGLLAKTLFHGGHEQIGQVLMHREVTPPEAYMREVDRNTRGLSRWFPLAAAARRIWSDPRLPRRPSVLVSLGVFVLNSHYGYARIAAPRWGRTLRFIRKLFRMKRWFPARRWHSSGTANPQGSAQWILQ